MSHSEFRIAKSLRIKQTLPQRSQDPSSSIRRPYVELVPVKNTIVKTSFLAIVVVPYLAELTSPFVLQDDPQEDQQDPQDVGRQRSYDPQDNAGG